MSFPELALTPQALHAATVHFPVALAILGVPLLLLAALRKKDSTLRWLTTAAYAALAISAFVAVFTGERTAEAVPDGAPQEAWDLIAQHEEMAEKVWVFAVATAVLAALSALKNPKVRKAGMILAIIAAVATAGWVSLVGHLGGSLVYQHGVGTPDLGASPDAQPPVPAESGEAGAESVGPEDDAYTPGIREIDVAEAAKVSYSIDIQPLLEERCTGCHNPGEKRGDVDLTSVESMLADHEEFGPVVLPGDPVGSPMVMHIRGIWEPKMPIGDEELTEDELHTIRMWIAAGAKDDSTGV